MLNSYLAKPLYYNCKFLDNSSRIAPVSISSFVARPVFLNCLVSNNACTDEQQVGNSNITDAYGHNAIIVNLLFSEMRLINCTLANNKGVSGSELTSRLICNVNESAAYVTNSILWGNVNSAVFDSLNTNFNSKISYSLAQGVAADATSHMLDGTGTAVIFTDSASGDFSLVSSSPAVNGGLNDSINGVLSTWFPAMATAGVDLVGNPRIVDQVVDMGAYELTSGGLAVKVSQLSGKIDATGQVVLTWKSFMESDNKGFSMEVSLDGVHFKSLGFVPSEAVNGHSQHTLSYHYNAGVITGARYYRFIQIDQSGQQSASNIVHLSAHGSGFKLQAYPNPVQNYLHIKITGDLAAGARIFLLDFTGKVLRQMKVTSSTFVMDMQGMAAGVYLLNYKDDHENKVIKVIKK